MKQQYQIVKKKVLTPEISQISVHAPLVAAKAKAGQFIILRVDENNNEDSFGKVSHAGFLPPPNFIYPAAI